MILYDGHAVSPLVKPGSEIVIAGLAVRAEMGQTESKYLAYGNQACVMALANLREAIPSERRCCGREICCLHMSILQGPCEQQCEDRENQPSGCLWVRIFGTGRPCRKKKFCLPVPILQWTCEQQREDRANQPSICVQQSILRQGR